MGKAFLNSIFCFWRILLVRIKIFGYSVQSVCSECEFVKVKTLMNQIQTELQSCTTGRIKFLQISCNVRSYVPSYVSLSRSELFFRRLLDSSFQVLQRNKIQRFNDISYNTIPLLIFWRDFKCLRYAFPGYIKALTNFTTKAN